MSSGISSKNSLSEEAADMERLLHSFDGDPKDLQLDPEKRPMSTRLIPRFSCNLAGATLALSVNAVIVYLLVFFTKKDDVLAYSPVLNHIHLPFSPRQMDAKQHTNQSIYVQEPSPEVDHAWNIIQDNIIMGITRKDIIRIGKDPDRAVPFNPDWGMGEDLYMAEIDVFHQIHCLNVLRKALVTNYDYYWGSVWGLEPPIDFKTHLRHCTGMLLQGLMCHADVEVITHEWHEDQPWPYPDFGVVKQCRDFDSLLAWAQSHDIEDSHQRYLDFRPPTGTNRIPKEEGTDASIGPPTGHSRGTDTQRIDFLTCNNTGGHAI